MEPSATAATGYPPGEGVPANATGKQSPDSGAFTLERPANRRLKKAPIVLLVVAVGVLLVVTLYLALRPVSRADSASVTAQVDSEAVKRAIPDALKLSERDFMPVKPDVPPLGPPLAGDLGGLQLKPALPLPAPVVTPPAPAYQPPPAPKQPTPEELARLRREQLARERAEKALASGLFFEVPNTRPAALATIGQPGVYQPQSVQTVPSSHAAQPSYQALWAAAQQGQGRAAPVMNEVGQGSPGQLPAVSGQGTALHWQAAGSPYQLKAGAMIPAVLLTGINADLPGQIIAQVREQVFDTVSGRYLLIPQGTRVLGQYDANIGYGQERAGVIWNRLIFPDGASVQLGNMPGVDAMGQSGYQDQVDHHWRRLATGVVLSSLLAGTAGQYGDREGFSGRFYHNAGVEINRAGQQLTRNNLNLQPTIRIRPGFSINILVNRDLTLKPVPQDQPNPNPNPWEAGLFAR